MDSERSEVNMELRMGGEKKVFVLAVNALAELPEIGLEVDDGSAALAGRPGDGAAERLGATGHGGEAAAPRHLGRIEPDPVVLHVERDAVRAGLDADGDARACRTALWSASVNSMYRSRRASIVSSRGGGG